MSYTSFEQHVRNPYYPALPASRFRVKVWGSKTYTPLTLTDPKTGEVVGKVTAKKDIAQLQDTEHFCKVYLSATHTLCSLNLSAYRLLFFIIGTCEVEQVLYTLDVGLAMDFCKYSNPNMVYRAVATLLQKDIISRSAAGKLSFWINPSVIFKGRLEASFKKWLDSIEYGTDTDHLFEDTEAEPTSS